MSSMIRHELEKWQVFGDIVAVDYNNKTMLPQNLRENVTLN